LIQQSGVVHIEANRNRIALVVFSNSAQPLISGTPLNSAQPLSTRIFPVKTDEIESRAGRRKKKRETVERRKLHSLADKISVVVVITGFIADLAFLDKNAQLPKGIGFACYTAYRKSLY